MKTPSLFRRLILSALLLTSTLFAVSLPDPVFAQSVLVLRAAASGGYDAELDIGLVANNPADAVATANTTKLTNALNAQHESGAFIFTNGSTGPVLRPIKFAAKEFFFKGVIKSSKKMGGGMVGFGSRPYVMSEAGYAAADGQGGACTRLTRIDGELGGPVLLLRGTGFLLQGLELKSQRWTTGSTYLGTRARALIEVEGRDAPASGKHTFRDLSLAFATYGIYCPPGYYADNDTYCATVIGSQAHADETNCQNIHASHIDSFWRCENEQSVGWSFRDIFILGSAVSNPIVVFDCYRSGKVSCDSLVLNAMAVTVLRVHEVSSNSNWFSIKNFHWDNFEYLNDPTGVYLTLFRHTHPDVNGQYYGVSLDMTGHIASDPAYYDESKLIQFTDAAFGTTTPFPNFQELQFRIKYLPLTVGGVAAWSKRGDMVYPRQAVWGPLMATNNRVIASGVITVYEDLSKVDVEGGVAGTDDLDTINGGMFGWTIKLMAVSSARTIVVTENGNIKLTTSSFSLDNSEDCIQLTYNGSYWIETSRNDNGAFVLPREWQRFRQPTLTTDSYATAV